MNKDTIKVISINFFAGWLSWTDASHVMSVISFAIGAGYGIWKWITNYQDRKKLNKQK